MKIDRNKLFVMQRLVSDSDATIGVMLKEKESHLISYVLEDEYRKTKVIGETRILAGIYPLTVRQVESGLTLKYRERYPWFEFHIMLENVPDFSYVYMHIGNTDKDSDACLLLADTHRISRSNEKVILESKNNYEAFYKRYYASIKEGGWHIWIRDEIYMFNYAQIPFKGNWKI